MKNRDIILKIALHFFSIILLSSCATHMGNLTSNAVLTNNNFKIIGIAVGESESTRVLGFGGLQNDALVFEAKNDLYKKVELKSGQTLTNMTVDFKREYYIVFSKTKVIVTGEIVDFNVDNEKGKKNLYGLQERNGYRIGEQVFVKIYSHYQKRTIEKLNLRSLEIENINPTLINYEDAFRLEGSFNYRKKNYLIGDEIEIINYGKKDSLGKQSKYKFNGKLIGISERFALIYVQESNKYIELTIEK